MCHCLWKSIYGEKTLKEAKRTVEDKDIIDDLIKGRVYWAGVRRQDHWSALKNTHVLLSMFLVHPLHPLGRFGRRIVFLSNIFTSLLIAGLIAQIGYEMKQDCELKTGTDKTDCLEGNQVIIHVYDWVFGFLCSIWMAFLAFFANCEWASKKSAGIRLLVTSIGNFYLYIGLLISILWGIGGILLGVFLPLGRNQFFMSFGFSQISSWVTDLIMGTLRFWWSWYWQRRAIQNGKKPFKWDPVAKNYKQLQEDEDRTLAEAVQKQMQAVQDAKDKVVQSVDTAVQERVDIVNNKINIGLEKIKIVTTPKSHTSVEISADHVAEPAVAAPDSTRSVDIASTETQRPDEVPKSPGAAQKVADGVQNAQQKVADSVTNAQQKVTDGVTNAQNKVTDGVSKLTSGLGKFIPSPKSKNQSTEADGAAAIP